MDRLRQGGVLGLSGLPVQAAVEVVSAQALARASLPETPPFRVREPPLESASVTFMRVDLMRANFIMDAIKQNTEEFFRSRFPSSTGSAG